MAQRRKFEGQAAARSSWGVHTVAQQGRRPASLVVSPNSCLGLDPASRKAGPSRAPRLPEAAMATYLGLAVAKAQVDVVVRPTGEVAQFPNDPAGHAALVAWALPLAPARIVVSSGPTAGAPARRRSPGAHPAPSTAGAAPMRTRHPTRPR